MNKCSLPLIMAFLAMTPALRASDTEKIHYPTTHGPEVMRSFRAIDGQFVAVEVRVEEIVPDVAYGKPYVRAAFANGDGPLWIAPIVSVGDNIKVGDVLHVLGIVNTVNGPRSAALKSLNPSGYHLMAICYYNFRTKNGLFFPFSSEPNQCSRWRDGATEGI